MTIISRFYLIINHFLLVLSFLCFNEKGKDLTINKYINVNNPLSPLKLWNVFSRIETHLLDFFADAKKVLLEYDQGLPLNRLI